MSDADEVVWAIALIVAVPLIVVLFGELAERLRQRRSAFAPVVSVVRLWVLPLGVALLAVRGLLRLDADRPLTRVVSTGLVVAAAVAAVMLIRVTIAGVTRRAEQQQRARPPQLLLAVPRLILAGVTLWLLLSVVWGVQLSNAIAALGVTSLVVSLALQAPLGALFSGFLLAADQPFRPGEWIRVGDVEGRVTDLNWRATTVCDRNGDLVVFPNSMLASATLVNYDRPERLHRVTLPVQVAFSNPPNRAIEMLLAAARSTPGVLATPAPDVKVTAVDDPLMTYEVQVWIDDHSDTPRIRSDLAALVWYWSERMEVPLPSPAQDLYLWDGPATAASKQVPTDELRRRLESSLLLRSLPDDELDRLAAASRHLRFGAGETMAHAGGGTGSHHGADQDLRLLHRGSARVVVRTESGGSATVTDLTPGDLFGLTHHDRHGNALVSVVAVTDCEVVEVEGGTAELVIARSPGLSDALTHLATTRQRRLDVLLDRGAG